MSVMKKEAFKLRAQRGCPYRFHRQSRNTMDCIDCYTLWKTFQPWKEIACWPDLEWSSDDDDVDKENLPDKKCLSSKGDFSFQKS